VTRLPPEVLVVMAKAPVPGEVKTRLAAQVGERRACALYEAFLRDIAARLAAVPWQLVWAVDPPAADLGRLIGVVHWRIDQRGADLGDRMRCCFEDLFTAGAERAVMIGADAPHLSEPTLRDAFAALASADVVLVPSGDGGYCLVGLAGAHDVFSGIEMGTPRVLAQTARRVASMGLRLWLLPESFDVDEMGDVRALVRLIATGAVRLDATEAELRKWGALWQG
jgi:rSAM/selenodomain-associated transferase 1